MSITSRKLMASLMRIFTAALFALFILFDTYTWGKYVFLLLSACVFVLGLILNHGKVKFKINAYAVLNILFICFVFASSLWAIQPSDSVIMGRTLLRTFVCAYAVYTTYINLHELNISVLLKAVMWAGYFVAIYALIFYGMDRMLAAGSDSSLRVDNEFSNVNTIGLACSLSCVIQINLKFIDSKTRLFPSVLFMIPSIVVMSATQSRKAFVFLIVGILGCVFVRAQELHKGLFIKTLKVLFWISILALIIYGFLQLEVFDGIRERMEGILDAVLGNGKVDHSTMVRNDLRSLGLEWFLKYPFGGVGIANPHILAAKFLNFDAYLHDNFVEMLCGGGIVGFCLYYAMYIYLFRLLWKYRNVDRRRTAFFILWLLLMLAMNYGMVTYYSKSQNFYLMIHFINVIDLRRTARSICRSENMQLH